MASSRKGLGAAGAQLLTRTPATKKTTTAAPESDPVDHSEPAGDQGAAAPRGSDGDSNRNHPPAAPPRRATSGGIVDALRRSDTGGEVVLRLPLEDVAPHPHNPRESLGDLEGLAVSLRELGQLQPALVVSREDFLTAHPEFPAVAKPWVVVAGHRRRAAAELAGLPHLEAIVKPNTDKVTDYLTFHAENVHRTGLTAIGEARIYAMLGDAGLGQRAIASRLGVSQGQVSKRLALLKLAQEVQDAITRDELSVADALSLVGVPTDHQVDVWRRARGQRVPIASVVASIERTKTAEKAAAKARKTAEQAGIPLVDDPLTRWGSGPDGVGRHRLYSDDEVEEAREAGDLLAQVTSNGLTYFSASPVRPASRPSADDPDEKRERKKAREARATALQTYVLQPPAAAEATAAVIDLTLFHSGLYAECLKLTHKWLGERIGDPSDDPYTWCRSLADKDLAQRRWAAWAMSVAHTELRTRDAYQTWGPAQKDFFHALFLAVGYQPTPWERARLDAIPATASPDQNSSAPEVEQ